MICFEYRYIFEMGAVRFLVLQDKNLKSKIFFLENNV